MRRLAIAMALMLSVAGPAAADTAAGLIAYQNGDYATAFQEFSNDAALQSAEAEYNLGLLYYFGLGVTQNFPAAAEWVGRAAIQDYAPAQFMLGAMYERGEGNQTNLNLAKAWYERAAEHGHVDAQYRAGMLIAFGDGVAHDPVAATVWLTLASGKGHADAQANLAKVADGLTQAELVVVSQLAATFQQRAENAGE